jgi:hypothetical protein
MPCSLWVHNTEEINHRKNGLQIDTPDPPPMNAPLLHSPWKVLFPSTQRDSELHAPMYFLTHILEHWGKPQGKSMALNRQIPGFLLPESYVIPCLQQLLYWAPGRPSLASSPQWSYCMPALLSCTFSICYTWFLKVCTTAQQNPGLPLHSRFQNAEACQVCSSMPADACSHHSTQTLK